MAKRKSLSTLVAEDLARKVMDGTLEPGARLPTEAALCDQYEVSRTVIREAVARLRSEGLLLSHQGRGMFVANQMPSQKFEIDENSLNTLPETISLLELRLSVEVEAAGLCAERRNISEAKETACVHRRVARRGVVRARPDAPALAPGPRFVPGVPGQRRDARLELRVLLLQLRHAHLQHRELLALFAHAKCKTTAHAISQF